MNPTSHPNSESAIDSTAPEKSHPSTVTSWLSNTWRYLVRGSIRDNEPRVWQERSPSGHYIWRAYDPQSGRSAYRRTEAEMVDWLEQRTHHQ
jgi:hypothetical protein